MDIREFSTKLAEATRNMTSEEREAIRKMFQGMSDQITKEEPASPSSSCTTGCGNKSRNSDSRWTNGAYIGSEETVYELEAIYHNTPCKSNYKDL